MKAVILKCAPGANFHLGRVGLDDETSLNDTSELIHSDTLVSALIDTTAKVWPEKLDQLIEWLDLGKIRLSSGYFALEISGAYVYFLPKPLSLNLTSTDAHKQLKRISFLSKGVWEKGYTVEQWFGSNCVVIQDKLVCLKEEFETEYQIQKLFAYNSAPKVAVHKESKEDSIYYQTNLEFVKLTQAGINQHFYFLVQSELSERDILDFYFLVKILAANGLGGQKSTGTGVIESVEINDFDLKVNDSEEYCTLSLTVPKDAAEFSKFKYYNLLIRGGRPLGFGKFKLKRIRMLQEGAVFKGKAEGAMVNIKPDEINDNYFRSGKAFSVPLNFKN